jgi:hypothetical protein
MMDADTETFLSYLRERLSAFKVPLHERTGFFRRRTAVSKPWVALLMESNAITNNGIKPGKPESLCGYSWARNVPWESR